MTQKKKIKGLSVMELWSLLERTVFGISRMREIELDQCGLTIAQSAILTALRNRGIPMTIQELERDGMRQHHSVSTLINRMVQMGLVSKETSLDDKRYRITITKDGREQCNKISFAALEMTFSVLSAEEKLKLAILLNPLLERARYLLGQSQKAPFLRQPDKSAGGKNRKELTEITDFGLWALFDRIGFAIARLCELELAQFGLTPPQAFTLEIIESNGGEATFRELEDNSLRQHHSIFILVNRMEKLGLIQQVRNPRDKVPGIVMTKEGMKKRSELTRVSLDMTFSVLSPEQRQQLAAYLNPLLERVRYLLGVSYTPPFIEYLMSGDTDKTAP